MDIEETERGYIHIYIYRERERKQKRKEERKRDRERCVHVSAFHAFQTAPHGWSAPRPPSLGPQQQKGVRGAGTHKNEI